VTASAKKARFAEDATPSAPPSTVFTEAASVAESSMTSRSTSKRPKKYLCQYDGCDKAFDRPVRLEAHVRTHTDDRPFACSEPGCDKSFFKSEHLKAHVQNKHANEANYVCTYVLQTGVDDAEVQCGRTFTTGTRLRRHVAAHEAKEETKCKEPGCGQVFRKMETLQRHVLKDHLKENAFRCTHVSSNENLPDEECGQAFPTVGQLKAHENREHGGLKHFCTACSTPTGSDEDEEQIPVGFQTYAELQAHMKEVHPPTCDLCQAAFPSNRALTAHMEIEHCTLASRQKFFCDYPGCERGFTRQGNLKVHYQTVHVKVKNFSCGQTDLGSSTNVPGWDGHGCGISFGTKASLEGHIRTQHLGLPVLSGGRPRKIKSEDISEVSTPMDCEELPGSSINGQLSSTLALLTGHGYDEQRPLECWQHGCPYRFSRDYDLGQHMEVAHGWTVDSINDRFTEHQALSGEDFWLGGQEKDHVSLHQDEDVLRQQLEDALKINAPGIGGGSLSRLETERGDEMMMEDGDSLPARHSDENVAVDPSLL